MNAEDTQLNPGPSLDSTISDEDIAGIFGLTDSTNSTDDGNSTDHRHNSDISGDSENNSGKPEGTVEAEKGEERSEESRTEPVEFVTAPILSSLFSQLELDFDDDELSAAIVKHGDDMEGLAKVIKDVIDSTVEANSAPQYASQLSEQFDNFLRNDGDPRKFFDMIYSNVDYNKIDLSDVNNQALLLREYYRATTPFSNEKIDKTIKALYTAGELESTAKEAKDDLIQLKEEERLQLLKEQEVNAARQQQQFQEQINRQKSAILNGTKSELGYAIPESEKKGFVKYLFDRDPVTQKTAYQTKMESTPNFGIRLAYLAYKNVLTEEGLAKVATTKSTQKIKSTVEESIDKLRARPKNNTSPAVNLGSKGDRAYLEDAVRDLTKAAGLA